MNITDTVNRLLKKATDLRQRADHLEAVANDLVIVGDEEFGEGEAESSKMKAFKKLGKTPLDSLPPVALEPIPNKKDIKRKVRLMRCKYCKTSVENVNMGNHVRYRCPVVKHGKQQVKNGKGKNKSALHWTQKPENKKRLQEAGRARWAKFRREHGPKLVQRRAA